MGENRCRLLLATGVAALGVVTAACTSPPAVGQAAPATATTTTTSTTTTSTTYTSATTTSAATPSAVVPVTSTVAAAASPVLRFPGTDLTVHMTGYDDSVQMVTFVLVRRDPGNSMVAPYYEQVPDDPGPYRLPLAANASIRSWSIGCTGAFDSAADAGGDQCTTAQLITGLRTGARSIAALHVDDTDHISTVREIFTP